ncbi:hypothetical protein NDU88_003609 [Pleurodeles waltl]|uniref:Uncharacterized protein n=1 Tax=Pleurodeles waltl TaxID=8319 RepID=A0AAV7NRC0_PLEWA|nr:hypothetical protein NDU88_003609 [Pleurodeles waltl]
MRAIQSPCTSGTEGQSQWLRAIGHLKPELEEGENKVTDGRREGNSSTEEGLTRSRGDATDDGGSEAQLGDPDDSTSDTGGAQREFWPRLGKIMAPQVGGKPKLVKGRGGREEAKAL